MVAPRNRILVAEDEIDALTGLEKLLKSRGYDVETARDGLEAAEKVRLHRYDVVVSDLKMPRMDGIGLLQTAKEKDSNIIFIIITGYGTVDSAVEAMRLGAREFIAKPFNPSELIASIEKAINPVPVAEEPEPLTPEADELSVRRCHLDHAWYAVQSDGTVLVGADEEFYVQAGEIVYCDLPFEYDSVVKGQVCVRTVNAGQTVRMKLRSPLSGTVVRINEKMMTQPWLAQKQPYAEGWLFAIVPSRLEQEM